MQAVPGSPKVVVGFQCSQPCHVSTPERRAAPQRGWSLLSRALQQNQPSQHCDSAHYSDEYETDDEFFCEEEEDAEEQQQHCSPSNSSVCSSQHAALSSSDPIDIPYKR